MARQHLTIGTFGDIGFRTSPNGRIVARARYRYWDGKSRLVQATGDTRKQAERGSLPSGACSSRPSRR